MNFTIITVSCTIRSNSGDVCLTTASKCENTYSFRQLVPISNDVNRFFVSYIACFMCYILAENHHQFFFYIFTVNYINFE